MGLSPQGIPRSASHLLLAAPLTNVIPSAVSRPLAFARSAGTRSRGIPLRFDGQQHFHTQREPLIYFCRSLDACTNPNRLKSLPRIVPAQARFPDRKPSSIPASATNLQTSCPTHQSRP